MFRKIHSNRDPRDTIASELKKEFKPYYEMAGKGLNNCLERYPKPLFWLMSVAIIISVVLSFSVFRQKGIVAVKKPTTAATTIGQGMGQLLKTGSILNETIELKQCIDSLSLLKVMSHTDSLQLNAALDRLQQLNKSINPK